MTGGEKDNPDVNTNEDVYVDGEFWYRMVSNNMRGDESLPADSYNGVPTPDKVKKKLGDRCILPWELVK